MRRVFESLLLVCLLPACASAASSYWVGYDINGPTITSPTPFVRDSAWSTNNGFCVYTGASHAYAQPGGAGISVVSTADFLGGYMVQPGFHTNAGAQTDDFLITGPPGVTSVTATFYFRVQGNITVTGGSPSGYGNGGVYDLYAYAAGLGFWGEMQVGIGSHYGQGAFAGLTQDGVAMGVPLTGTFPVGTPFLVQSRVYLMTAHYGNITVTPGSLNCSALSAPEGFDAGIGNGLGRVMDLPPGYDLSSPSWNVVHNRMAPTLDVAGDAPPERLALSMASGNPSSGPASLRFALPADGRMSITIVDVAGRRVCTLADGWRAAGEQSIGWDGRDDSGSPVPPGVYLAVLRAGPAVATTRIVRIR